MWFVFSFHFFVSFFLHIIFFAFISVKKGIKDQKSLKNAVFSFFSPVQKGRSYVFEIMLYVLFFVLSSPAPPPKKAEKAKRSWNDVFPPLFFPSKRTEKAKRSKRTVFSLSTPSKRYKIPKILENVKCEWAKKNFGM